MELQTTLLQCYKVRNFNLFITCKIVIATFFVKKKVLNVNPNFFDKSNIDNVYLVDARFMQIFFGYITASW